MKFLTKKQTELNVAETFGFLVIYMALYLSFMWVVMEFDTVTGKIKSAWRKVKGFFNKLKRKLVG